VVRLGEVLPPLCSDLARPETAVGLEGADIPSTICATVRADRAAQEQPEAEAQRRAIDQADRGGRRQSRRGGGRREVRGADVHEELRHDGVFR
jgi:hypothetical protein